MLRVHSIEPARREQMYIGAGAGWRPAGVWVWGEAWGEGLSAPKTHRLIERRSEGRLRICPLQCAIACPKCDPCGLFNRAIVNRQSDRQYPVSRRFSVTVLEAVFVAHRSCHLLLHCQCLVGGGWWLWWLRRDGAFITFEQQYTAAIVQPTPGHSHSLENITFIITVVMVDARGVQLCVIISTILDVRAKWQQHLHYLHGFYRGCLFRATCLRLAQLQWVSPRLPVSTNRQCCRHTNRPRRTRC
jgi:hypothetical protein